MIDGRKTGLLTVDVRPPGAELRPCCCSRRQRFQVQSGTASGASGGAVSGPQTPGFRLMSGSLHSRSETFSVQQKSPLGGSRHAVSEGLAQRSGQFLKLVPGQQRLAGGVLSQRSRRSRCSLFSRKPEPTTRSWLIMWQIDLRLQREIASAAPTQTRRRGEEQPGADARAREGGAQGRRMLPPPHPEWVLMETPPRVSVDAPLKRKPSWFNAAAARGRPRQRVCSRISFSRWWKSAGGLQTQTSCRSHADARV